MKEHLKNIIQSKLPHLCCQQLTPHSETADVISSELLDWFDVRLTKSGEERIQQKIANQLLGAASFSAAGYQQDRRGDWRKEEGRSGTSWRIEMRLERISTPGSFVDASFEVRFGKQVRLLKRPVICVAQSVSGEKICILPAKVMLSANAFYKSFF